MARDLSHLEPAERDPVQLRRTGLTIAAIMLVGGALVMAAYLVKTRADGQDARPHIVGRLTQAFGGRDQDGQAFVTSQLEGKISLVTPICGTERERTAESLRVMKLVAERFPDDERYRFVGITVDPENDGPEQLKAMLADLGVTGDPRWLFVQAEEKNARGYLRKMLRLETSETIRMGDKEVKRFRSGIVLIDPNLHVLEPQYDFNLAREVQEDAKRLLRESPEEAARLKAADRTEDLAKAEASLLQTLEFIRNGNLKEGSGK